MTYFLSYWTPDSAEREAAHDALLDHSASNQYKRVGLGDTVWIVTYRDGVLWLVGRIDVDQVTDQAGAELRFGRDDLWEADYHIVAVDGTELPVAELDIQDLAESLRFESPGGRDRLILRDDGTVNPQQLQAMRVLSLSSANLLARRLNDNSVANNPDLDPVDEDYTRWLTHRVVERNPRLVKKVKTHHGYVCQACGLKMEGFYGKPGHDYIEAHHLTPVAELKGKVVRTDPKTDFAVLCPNCHRMIHRSGSLDDVAALRSQLDREELRRLAGL